MLSTPLILLLQLNPLLPIPNTPLSIPLTFAPMELLALLHPIQAAGPSTNFNPCSSTSSGFRGIDSTNRVTYVECSNYEVVASFECGEGMYFDHFSGDEGDCVFGSWDDSVIDSVVSANGGSSDGGPCNTVIDGFIPIDSSGRVTYIHCYNYGEVARYDCPGGFYFEETTEMCVEGVWDGAATSGGGGGSGGGAVIVVEPTVGSVVTISTVDDTAMTTASAITTTTTTDFSTSKTTSSVLTTTSITTIISAAATTATAKLNTSNSENAANVINNSNSAIAEPEIVPAPQQPNPGYISDTPTCDDFFTGNVPLPSLQGYLVCSDGDILVTQYCGSSTLFDIDSGTCRNYCRSIDGVDESSSMSVRQGTTTPNAQSPIQELILSKLSGRISCDSSTGTMIESIVCSMGTYYDVSSGYCRNFCLDGQCSGEYHVPFPNIPGGVTCQNQQLVSTTFCPKWMVYSSQIGVCMETDSPTANPVVGAPTLSTVHLPTGSPSIGGNVQYGDVGESATTATIASPPFSNGYLESIGRDSAIPTVGVELVVDIIEDNREYSGNGENGEEEKKKKKPKVVNLESKALGLRKLIVFTFGMEVILLLLLC